MVVRYIYTIFPVASRSASSIFAYVELGHAVHCCGAVALRTPQDKLQQEAVQQDPEEMENVLNLLSTLQDQAESKRVYDLDTKVQRMMDLMGFSIRQDKTVVGMSVL